MNEAAMKQEIESILSLREPESTRLQALDKIISQDTSQDESASVFHHRMLNDGKGPDFKYDNSQQPLILERPLPAQVEKTCEIFSTQFGNTAQNLFSVADQLETIAGVLREKAIKIDAASQSVPQAMRDWVRTEREFSELAAFYQPLLAR